MATKQVATEVACSDPLIAKPVTTSLPLGIPEPEESVSKTIFKGTALLKLWIVLIVTLAYSLLLLICSHVTHSLTLRVEAYHSLYNLMTLGGCLVTIQVCQREDNLKNTFGWARVELLSTLCTLMFLGSLCFGVAMDCIQTAAHAGHQDAMHHPTPIIALGAIGLSVNAFVFWMIGGYTHHQGCFLERRPSGVWIRGKVSKDAVQSGMRTLSTAPTQDSSDHYVTRSYQGALGTLRDITGLILMMICAAIVRWDQGGTIARYVDPGFAVLSAVILLCLSYPYAKECGQILLQTIPGHIDVQSFSERLLNQFPDIVNIHHLHIWSFTPTKVIATAHVVFSDPSDYKKMSGALDKFFKEEEITKVTLQPEFLNMPTTPSTSEYGSCACLLPCEHENCTAKSCCLSLEPTKEAVNDKAIPLAIVRTRKDSEQLSLSIRVDDCGTSVSRTPELKLPCDKDRASVSFASMKNSSLSASTGSVNEPPENSVLLPRDIDLSEVSSSKLSEFLHTMEAIQKSDAET